ncbi:hypothetical protein [Streptomyces chartreusis]|uniref:hypothetical protein n=1 Tax=Streptomyces chartreusis TaxID=1969 RepID=UPI00378B29B6
MQFAAPLTYTDDDGIEYEYETVEFLAEDVEFANDYHNDYKCYDAAGQRFRLVISGMRLLLIQPVPAGFQVVGIQIRQAHFEGNEFLTETFEGSPLRCLVRRNNSRWEHLDPFSIDSATDGAAAEMSPERFDALWVESAEKA